MTDTKEENVCKALKIVSLLLSYPDKGFIEDVSEVETALETMPSNTFKKGVGRFLSWCRSQPAIRLEEEYTAAFDLDPSMCLNMAYHRWADGEERSRAMAALRRLYLEAGYEPDSGDLPDYLPMMLEFVAIRPESRREETIRECFKSLEKLIDSMKKKAPFYAELLELVLPYVGPPRSRKTLSSKKKRIRRSASGEHEGERQWI